MSRPKRIAVTLAALVLGGSLLYGLSRLGRASAGPLGDALDGLGAAVSEAEHAVLEVVRGPGRSDRLEWLDPYRRDPSALRNPGRILLGAYDEGIPGSLDGVFRLEDAVGFTFPLVHVYVAWGDLLRERFPGDFVRAVRQSGSIPLISWEPWLTDFRAADHPELPPVDERADGGLRAIARGEYDFYVDRWARKAAAFGGPILIRFAHEMNDPYRYPWGPQNNEPVAFVDAWRHVVERFRAAGAHNVLWVWSPHPAYGEFELYYPGDDWVDWVGTTVLNYGDAAPWSRWWSFHEIFGQHYDELEGFGKPLMLAELGSLAVGGDRSAWYASVLDSLPARHPAVKAVVFYASSRDATVTGKAVDWSFAGDSAVRATVRSALQGWPDLPKR